MGRKSERSAPPGRLGSAASINESRGLLLRWYGMNERRPLPPPLLPLWEFEVRRTEITFVRQHHIGKVRHSFLMLHRSWSGRIERRVVPQPAASPPLGMAGLRRR